MTICTGFNIYTKTLIGTGKSFIGALLAKALHDETEEKIVVLCYTNHALDQFLEDLLDIGIPEDSMLRLGSKSSTRTKSLGLYEQQTAYKTSGVSWAIIDALKPVDVDIADTEVGSGPQSVGDLPLDPVVSRQTRERGNLARLLEKIHREAPRAGVRLYIEVAWSLVSTRVKPPRAVQMRVAKDS